MWLIQDYKNNFEIPKLFIIFHNNKELQQILFILKH